MCMIILNEECNDDAINKIDEDVCVILFNFNYHKRFMCSKAVNNIYKLANKYTLMNAILKEFKLDFYQQAACFLLNKKHSIEDYIYHLTPKP